MSASIAPKGATCFVAFNSNDQRGQHRFLVEAVEFEVAISEDRTTAFTLEGDEIPILIVKRNGETKLSLGNGGAQRSFDCCPDSHQRHVGNLLWDGVTMAFDVATALSHYLLECGWVITDGDCEPGELERAVNL